MLMRAWYPDDSLRTAVFYACIFDKYYLRLFPAFTVKTRIPILTGLSFDHVVTSCDI
jgi:hypothetical protein